MIGDDDRLPENRIDGIPPHDPPPELAEYFRSSGALNERGSAIFATRPKHKPQWWEDEPGQSLALYIWKLAGGSWQPIGDITGFTKGRCRNLKEHAEKIAEVRGFYEKKSDDTVIYVEVDQEKLGESMMGTVKKLHERLEGLIAEMDDPKQIESAIKTMASTSLLLQGKPTGRTATVNEKPVSEKKLRDELDTFQRTLDKIDGKKGFKPANREVT